MPGTLPGEYLFIFLFLNFKEFPGNTFAVKFSLLDEHFFSQIYIKLDKAQSLMVANDN